MKKRDLVVSGLTAQIQAGLTIVTILLAIVAAVEFGSARGSEKGDGKTEGTPAIGLPQGRDEVRVELTAVGFVPPEVQHAPGTFAIAVENSVLTGEYTLQLRAGDGTLLNELRVEKGSSAWTVSLQAGTYTLTEASHSEWTCRIVIQ